MAEYRVPSTTKVAGMITTHAAELEKHGVYAGLAASRPAAGTVGRYYFSTDTKKWSRDNSATWDDIEGGLSESAVQALIDSSISTHAADTSYDSGTDEVVFQIT